MAELLDDIRTQLNARLEELRPLADEAQRLQGALDALDTATASTSQPARQATRARGRNGSARRRGRQAQGTTVTAIIDYVRANPGATAGDVAKALGLKRNSTSTRLTQLAKAGELVKAKRGYAVA
jgi:hypothetical protein